MSSARRNLAALQDAALGELGIFRFVGALAGDVPEDVWARAIDVARLVGERAQLLDANPQPSADAEEDKR